MAHRKRELDEVMEAEKAKKAEEAARRFRPLLEDSLAAACLQRARNAKAASERGGTAMPAVKAYPKAPPSKAPPNFPAGNPPPTTGTPPAQPDTAAGQALARESERPRPTAAPIL